MDSAFLLYLKEQLMICIYLRAQQLLNNPIYKYNLLSFWTIYIHSDSQVTGEARYQKPISPEWADHLEAPLTNPHTMAILQLL